jgi:hypothetical protein
MTTPSGKTLYSIRMSRSFRAVITIEGDFIRFVSLQPDPDSVYTYNRLTGLQIKQDCYSKRLIRFLFFTNHPPRINSGAGPRISKTIVR